MKITARQTVLFGAIFLLVFALSFTILALLGLVPSELEIKKDVNLVAIVNAKADEYQNPIGSLGNHGSIDPAQIQKRATGPQPTRLTIAKIGVDVSIQNPTSRDSKVLDSELTKGVVRYPGSGLPEEGTMFLFGHSSTLAVIHNNSYKALNHLDYLKADDVITVYTADKEYTYKVISVTKKNEGQALIDLSTTKHGITISTCDTFSGIKQQRIIVEADFVSSQNRLTT